MLEASVLFLDLTIIFVTIAILSFIAKFFKQPLIPVYIIAGIILVPLTHSLHNGGLVSSISQFGIVFLLFIAGLELDFERLKHVGAVSTMGGTIIVVLLFLIGLGVSSLIGFTGLSSVYMGLVFAFSSTMVVVKLLSDDNELDSLHGKIALGLLIVQDVFAILAFILLTSIGNFSIINLLTLIGSVLAIIVGVFLVSKYILPKLFAFAAESQEVLFIASIAICLLIASLFGQFLNPEALGIGAFIAGLALANLPYNIEIISRISPLKDFFSMLFFLSIGMLLPLSDVPAVIVPSIIFVLMILIIKPVLNYIIISVFGYMPRVAFLTAVTQSQVSEFGLILVFFGIATGQISNSLFASVVVIAILSLTCSSYMFEHKDFLFNKLNKLLCKIGYGEDQSKTLRFLPKKFKKKFILLVGYDRLGYTILETLKKMREIVVVVDFNPAVIKKLMDEKINCVYGDVGDSELLNNLNLNECKLIISTTPHKEANLLLMKKLRNINKKALCFLTSESISDALKLYESGADYVIIPRYIGGKHISFMVRRSKFNPKVLLKQKLSHLNELKRRSGNVTRHR